jgi:hypothetical protein
MSSSSNYGIQGTGPATQASYANPVKGMTENETLTKLCGGPLGSLKSNDQGGGGGGGGSGSGLGDIFGNIFKTVANVALGAATGGISTMVSGFVGGLFGGTGDKKA